MSKAKHIGYVELESEYGIKRGTAYSKVSKREIPHVRIGPRHVLFDREEIERWINEHRVAAVPEQEPPRARRAEPKRPRVKRPKEAAATLPRTT